MSGIYIHIPFCSKKCTYCDFHFATQFSSYRTQMIAALLSEIELRKNSWSRETFSTLYFGGGTPSLLTQEELSHIIEALKKQYRLEEKIEITLEINPENCSITYLTDLKEIGVTRLSIGLQSSQQSQLDWMNRAHNSMEGIQAIKDAQRVGFNEISVDLMYGLPDLSDESWKKELKQLIELSPEHISAYCLTIEEKTLLSKWVNAKKMTVSTNDQQAEQFQLLQQTLAENGYEQYEISNFARNGFYAKHNTAYWQGKKYLALGPSAHGFDGEYRYWNIANNPEYIRQIEQKKLPETKELLSNLDQFNELIMTGLRTKWGVNKKQLFALLTPSKQWWNELDAFILNGAIISNDEVFVLSVEARLQADAIASELFVLTV